MSNFSKAEMATALLVNFSKAETAPALSLSLVIVSSPRF